MEVYDEEFNSGILGVIAVRMKNEKKDSARNRKKKSDNRKDMEFQSQEMLLLMEGSRHETGTNRSTELADGKKKEGRNVGEKIEI
ncbi:hypothetical protein NPIL_398801 [Nephila pilipes]|uniref:Uncharacterized protein n=1 Tax=Nephila pilipes TaxID=299642 RepID=A0A8X6R409_NEPPI|nr:hypothetical protein NPIL_398801 [Nephila pilipes]